MSDRYDQLTLRHARLKALCAMQREHLAATQAEIHEQLGGVDHRLDVAKRIVTNPLIVVGGIALVAFAGPKRLWHWVSRGLVLYGTVRRVIEMTRRGQGTGDGGQ